MKQLTCPHCGFLNFAISAYCGRCERPLRAMTTPPPPRPASAAAPRVPTPVPTHIPMPSPPTPSSVAPPRPIEMSEAILGQAEQHGHRSGEETYDPIAPLGALANAGLEVTVQLAASWQIVASRVIDAALVLGLGAFVAWIDAWLLGPGWRPHGADWAGAVSSWLEAYETTTWAAGTVVVVAGSAYSVLAGLYGGRTLGRMATGTVLVHAGGRRLSPARMLLRAGVAWLSVAMGGAGFFWAILDRQRRSWHDRVAGTVLVRRHTAIAAARLPI